MGIKGLNALINEHSPKAFRNGEMKTFFGRKVAIDASMCLYQFLIAVRQQDGQQLANEEGETTSHLMGFFYRTIRMVGYGIKPCYVFDGKPPVLKGGELEKRLKRREEAEKQRLDMKETGTLADIAKFERRTVRVTREQNDQAKKLLELMGIPYVDAPCEAEAQCAELAKGGKVYAAASEDMDTLCYETPYLLRHMTTAEARKLPVTEIDYAKVMEGLEMELPQFIDLCILLGCDYCETIKGVGPVTAFKLIKEHGSIEKVVEAIENNPKSKQKIPENWPYNEARELFLHPEVIRASECELEWKEPDEEALVDYMVRQHGFSEQRIRDGASKLRKSLKTGTQGRLDKFFVVKKRPGEEKKGKNTKEEKSKKKRK
ncbi:Elongation of fatty acids protein 2 [Komagataella kurtzmanii]|nr:Elongation of fatty acids protein 2 [Komagataella kurtzmanii]